MAFTIPKDFSNIPKMIAILFFHPWLSSKKANVVFSDIQVDYFLPLSKSASLRRIIVTLVVEKIALKIDLRAYHKKPSKLSGWLGKMCATPGWFSYEDNGKKNGEFTTKIKNSFAKTYSTYTPTSNCFWSRSTAWGINLYHSSIQTVSRYSSKPFFHPIIKYWSPCDLLLDEVEKRS